MQQFLVHTELSSRLPAPPPEIGPASVMVGNLVSGKRIAQASGRDLGQIEDNDQARKVCVRGGSAGFLHHRHHHKHYTHKVHIIRHLASFHVLLHSDLFSLITHSTESVNGTLMESLSAV